MAQPLREELLSIQPATQKMLVGTPHEPPLQGAGAAGAVLGGRQGQEKMAGIRVVTEGEAVEEGQTEGHQRLVL